MSRPPGFRNRFTVDPFCSKRTNNFGSVLQIFWIVEFMRPNSRHKSASFFPFSISHVTLTFPLTFKTFLLCVTEPGYRSTSLPIYCSGRKVEGNFTHKVNYRWDIRSFGMLRSLDW